MRAGRGGGSRLNARLYTRTLAHHSIPQLGEHFIDAIRHHDVVLWRDAQDAEPSAINSRLRVLKTLLADATVAFNLARDPSARVPRVREHKLRDDENANCLTPDQLRALLAAMSRTAPRWYPLMALLAFTRMRIVEAAALQWSDVDFNAATIQVPRSIERGRLDSTRRRPTRSGARRWYRR